MTTSDQNKQNVLSFGHQSVDQWPTPKPLDMARPMDLPLDLWPDILRDYANEASSATETPVGVPTLLALGTMALSVQGLANVKIKPDFQEPLNLYTLVVFKSSGGKSRTLNPLVDIVAEWQRLKNKEIEPKIAHVKSIRDTREARIKALRRKISNTDDEKDLEALEKQIWEIESNLPEVPSPIKLMSTDITTEHAATVMAQNPGVPQPQA